MYQSKLGQQMIRGPRRSEPPRKETVGATKPWWKKNKQNEDAGDFNKTRLQRETAKHHLNPNASEAKNGHSQVAEVATVTLAEKKRAPVRRQKTGRNLACANAEWQPLRTRSETAKHHLNPSSGEAKNTTQTGSRFWQWIRNSETSPKSELTRSKKRSVARGRSGTFGTSKEKEKSPST